MHHVGAIAALVVAALVPSAAHADHWSAPDRRGDATGTTHTRPADPDPSGCDDVSTPADATGVPNLDLTRLSVDHGREVVTVRVGFAELKPGDLAVEVPILTPRKDYTVMIDRHGRHFDVEWDPGYQSRVDRAAKKAEAQGDCTFYVVYSPGECRGLTTDVDTDHDVVTVAVPRSCLKDPRWVRVAADTSAYHSDPDSYTVYDDHWAPASRSDAREPVYGVRVRAPSRHRR